MAAMVKPYNPSGPGLIKAMQSTEAPGPKEISCFSAKACVPNFHRKPWMQIAGSLAMAHLSGVP